MFSKELAELDKNTVQLMIDEMQDELDEKNNTLAEIKKQLSDKEDAISEIKKTLSDKEVAISEKDQLIEDLTKKLQSLTEQLQERPTDIH